MRHFRKVGVEHRVDYEEIKDDIERESQNASGGTGKWINTYQPF